MAINQPAQKGKAVIILATPLRDTPDDQRVALYLSGLVRLGEIELLVPSVAPKKVPGSTFVELQENFDPSKHIPSEDLSATVVQCESFDDFFRTVDDQLSRTGRNGVVVFGTPVAVKQIDQRVGELFVSSSGGFSSYLPKLKAWMSVHQPVFPEIPSDCSHLATRVQDGLNTDSVATEVTKISMAIIDAIPVCNPEKAPSKREMKGWKFFKGESGDWVWKVEDDGRTPIKHTNISDFTKALESAIKARMIERMGLIASGSTPVVHGETTTFLSRQSSRSKKRDVFEWDEGGSLADDISRAVALSGNGKRISTFDSMLDRLEQIETEKIADIRDGELMQTFATDARSSARANQSRIDALPELEKRFFGTKSLERHVGEIVDVAVDSRKTINAILQQYNDISEIPFEEGLKLVSVIAVNQTATRQLGLLAGSERAQVAIEHVLSKRTENDVHQLIEPISPRVVAPVAAHVSALATDPEHIDVRGPLLIHVDETHAFAIQAMQQTSVDEEAKLVGKKALDKSEAERGGQTALSRAKTLPGELASLRESVDAPTVMDEVRAATPGKLLVGQVDPEISQTSDGGFVR